MQRPPHPKRLDDRFCITADGTVSWRQFLSDVARVRPILEGHDVICNLAPRRYDFAVMLAAAMLNGQVTVLPPSRAERAVEAAVKGAASPLMAESLDELADAGHVGSGNPEDLMTRLPDAPGEVHVFTSGSTGEPVRHVKRWATLAGGARQTDEIIARAGLDARKSAIIGTTPHQHMYGLEAAMFTGLAFDCCLCDGMVFYPGDLEDQVEQARSQGIDAVILVTSPPHLRYLEETVCEISEIRCVISATAPLHGDVARRIEAGGGCKVFEIYGSTESGSMSWRRTAMTEHWSLLEGFHLSSDGGAWFASASHLATPVALADEIELDADGRFRLLGRHGDMVLIAGKRQSLGALNATLSSMPGIRDGVVVRESIDGEDRLTVFIVADPMCNRETRALRHAVRDHMRRHFDPVFVPRRIRIVERLPRGETGKISARDLVRLAHAEP